MLPRIHQPKQWILHHLYVVDTMPNFSDLRQVTKATFTWTRASSYPCDGGWNPSWFSTYIERPRGACFLITFNPGWLQHYAFVFNLGQLEQTMVDIQLRCTVLNLNLSPSTLFKPNLYSCPKVTLASHLPSMCIYIYVPFSLYMSPGQSNPGLYEEISTMFMPSHLANLGVEI